MGWIKCNFDNETSTQVGLKIELKKKRHCEIDSVHKLTYTAAIVHWMNRVKEANLFPILAKGHTRVLKRLRQWRRALQHHAASS